MAALVDPVYTKLSNVLGADRARDLIQELKRSLDLSEMASPAARLRVGNALIKRGGLLEAVGRSLKIQAMLHGAKE